MCLYLFSWRNSSRSKAASLDPLASACICLLTHCELALWGPHKALDLYSEVPSTWVISLSHLVYLVSSHVSILIPPLLMASGSPKGGSPFSAVTGGSGTGTFSEVWLDWRPYRCGDSTALRLSLFVTTYRILGLWFKSLFHHFLWDLRN